MTALLKDSQAYSTENQQLMLDFDHYIPKKPYCSLGKGFPTIIRNRANALKYPQIQINGPALNYWLVFDVDRASGGLAWKDANLPDPYWVSINPENGHAHIVYLLALPVCTSDAARLKPLRYLAAVYYAMAAAMKADKQYSGLLTHNPKHKVWRTIFGPRYAYELEELADYVDLPPFDADLSISANQNVFSYGRNCHLFDRLRHWAYVAIRQYRGGLKTPWNDAVYQQARAYNDFITPLSDAEVKAISRSVAKWVWVHDKDAQAKFLSRQRSKGIKSAEVRREKNHEKRIMAETMRLMGHTLCEIAEAVNVNYSTVSRWQREFKTVELIQK